jgi:hypothetical protein
MREREEIIRKEQMAAMLLRKENSTFWERGISSIIRCCLLSAVSCVTDGFLFFHIITI